MAIMMNDYLAHHGILGQKHGERNGPPYPLSRQQKSFKEKRLEDKAEKKKVKEAKKAVKVQKKQDEENKKDLSKITDDELRAMINRVKMEQEYRSLTEVKKKKGNTFIKETLTNIGKDLVREYSKKAIKNAIEAAIPSLSDKQKTSEPTTDLTKYMNKSYKDISNKEMNEIVKRISQEKALDTYKNEKTKKKDDEK